MLAVGCCCSAGCLVLLSFREDLDLEVGAAVNKEFYAALTNGYCFGAIAKRD